MRGDGKRRLDLKYQLKDVALSNISCNINVVGLVMWLTIQKLDILVQFWNGQPKTWPNIPDGLDKSNDLLAIQKSGIQASSIRL